MISLRRFAHTPFGTFGLLEVEGLRLFTLEERWRGNAAESCIPPGPSEREAYYYDLDPDYTGRFQHYRFRAVPDREAIEIHGGNTDADTSGCVLVGLGLGFVRHAWAVRFSKPALAKLHESLGDESHRISVSWDFTASPEDS